MAVAVAAPRTVTLTRLPNEPSDAEEFEVRWMLQPEGAGTRIAVEIEANLAVPRMVPLGGIGDAMAAAFVQAAALAAARDAAV